MRINKELKEYIEKNIFPEYNKNDKGHGIDHIAYVIGRSLKFASTVEDIDYNMVYVVAAYHDIAHHIDAKHHEELGAKILLEDNNLKKYFSDEQIKIMSEAVHDHRSSLEGEPRSIYGKIVSSADKNVLVDSPLTRTYYWRLEHCPNDSLEEIIENSRMHCLHKFGEKGYATEKMYFEDLDYKKFLEDITLLANNKEEFIKKYVELNIIGKPVKILYTNWEGKTGYRNIIPKSIEYKSTDWHKEKQWILDSYDIDKQADRGFALKDIKVWNVKENNMEKERLIELFNKVRNENKDMSLDDVLYKVYEEVKDECNEPFYIIRDEILDANNIDELDYYTKDVNSELKEYIEKNIFPKYEKNDKGHNLGHIKEVIKRSFALNDTFKLGLDHNMMYAIASCHDWGKYIDHKTHHLIAANNFMNDEGMKEFFTDEQRQIIKEAIEDHRSSKEDEPRSDYGKLVSSADRNTTVDLVFIRSFHVAHERTPEYIIDPEYLDFTINRLSKRYSEDDPENMFYEDKKYELFLKDMREILKHEKEFKDRYCEVNFIKDRSHRVEEEEGNVNYVRVLKKEINNK